MKKYQKYTYRNKDIKEKLRQRKWTLVSERLPEESGGYLVTMDAHCAEVPTYIAFAYFTEDLYAVDDHDFQGKKGIAGFYKRSSEWGAYEVNPIAWQPLPEPYKGEKNDK